MVFTVPKSGHMNPLWPILKELLKTGDFEISIFMDEKNRFQVESIGAKFKHIINNYEVFSNLHNYTTEMDPFKYLKAFYTITNDNIEYFATEIEKEQPDLIIYDFLHIPFKMVPRYYTKYYNLGQGLTQEQASKLKFFPKNPFPKTVCFSPSFLSNEAPKDIKLNPWTIIQLIFIFILFKIRFGFTLNDFSPFNQPEIVKKIFYCIVPEIQPKSHLYDQKRYRFLGSTVDQNFTDSRAKEELFKNLLEQNDHKLIYASLGTVFNNSVSTYKTIIDAFKSFDQEPEESRHPSLKLKDFKIIVSLGEAVYNEINEMIKNGTYEVPENIILVKSAPQIDILKKACLFVTHGGMNSASESIHFAGKFVLCYKNMKVILVD